MGSRQTDPMRNDWFIDGYASERSRTIEPSQADGGYYLKLMASCLRVTRLLAGGLIPRNTAGGRCTVHGEICCEVTARQSFVSVWSFVHTEEPGNTKLVNTATAAATLIRSGKWRQRCSAFGGQMGSQSGPTDFCVNTSLLFTQDREVNSGPFLLFANWSTSAPLYQCQTHDDEDAVEVFVSLDKDCEHLGSLLGVLGYASTEPDSLTPRELKRCCVSGASTALRCDHVLDGECADGDVSDLMGYVV